MMADLVFPNAIEQEILRPTNPTAQQIAQIQGTRRFEHVCSLERGNKAIMNVAAHPTEEQFAAGMDELCR